MDNIQ